MGLGTVLSHVHLLPLIMDTKEWVLLLKYFYTQKASVALLFAGVCLICWCTKNHFSILLASRLLSFGDSSSTAGTSYQCLK